MTEKLLDEKTIKIAKKVLSKHNLCDSCLGRVFSKIDYEIDNEKKGEMLREKNGFAKINPKTCWLCEGLIDESQDFIKLIKKELKNYEYDTFLIGCKVDEELLEKEKELIDLSKSDYFESIKNELNRKIGLKLEKDLGKLVDFEKPDIMAVMDTSFNVVNLQIKSLYIYGRYKKYKRDMPQTRWFCKVCRGKGCRACGYSGKIYKSSVEEEVAKKILNSTLGEDESFHGAGREDVDVKMLGNGRPFVIEIKNPKKRNIDLKKIKDQINKECKGVVEVDKLHFSDNSEVARIKAAGFRKKYRVLIKCSKSLNNEKLKKVSSSLRGLTIKQLTPSRVAHRRAEMVREKHIYNCEIESVEETIATLSLETESGTYIKELVTGDNGRTKPSISEIIGSPCEVVELDVIEIKGE